MKQTIVVEINDPKQLDLLLQLAEEMGIKISKQTDSSPQLSVEDDAWKALMLQEMKQEWEHPDNDQWDVFIIAKLAA